MTSRPLVILGVVIILIASIAATGYIMNGSDSAPASSNTASSTVPASNIPASTSTTFYHATTTPARVPINTATSTLNNIPIPGQKVTAIDTSSWFVSVDNKLGFSIEYPAGLITGKHDNSLTLAFPKNTYFHWPLLDDAKVTVSTYPHSCPDIANISDGPRPAPAVEFSLNGYKFIRNMGVDGGAGQVYTDIAYDTVVNGSCYRIDLLDHGTNGSSFYVDDTSLIKKYDAQHAADFVALIDVVNAMVGTFRVLAQ